MSIAAVPNSEVVGKVPAKFGYNPGLDGLRALSVLGVIAGQHAEGSRHEAPPASTLAESADGTATKDAPAT